MRGKPEDAECRACPFYDTHGPLQVVRVAQEPCYWLVNRVCAMVQWLGYHDPVHNSMPSLNRREYLGLVVTFLFNFFTREYMQKEKAALQTQSANQMQKMGRILFKTIVLPHFKLLM